MGTDYHEPASELSAEARDVHRGLTSLIEELEAVDWYNQRVDVTKEEELKAVLLHNRDEEIEHAAMTLEWLRRRIPKFDEELRTYLFTAGPITEIEEGSQSESKGPGRAAGGASDLGIGSLKEGA